MDITITARHCAVSDTLRDRIAQRARRLDRYKARIAGVQVVLEVDRSGRICEVVARAPGGPPLAARAGGRGFATAAGEAIDRIERQLQRQRDRRRRRRAGRNARAALEPDAG
jgi:ribosomal subunit interface protein